MKRDFSPSRRAWNIALTAAVWAAAVLVIALTAGVIGLVLIRGIPHISWNFLSTTASVLKGTDGDRKSTRLNSSHANESRMPSSA